MACGLGLTSGPVIGSFLYDLGGFITPFIFFAVVMALCGLFMKKILPEQIDMTVEEALYSSKLD